MSVLVTDASSEESAWRGDLGEADEEDMREKCSEEVRVSLGKARKRGSRRRVALLLLLLLVLLVLLLLFASLSLLSLLEGSWKVFVVVLLL